MGVYTEGGSMTTVGEGVGTAVTGVELSGVLTSIGVGAG